MSLFLGLFSKIGSLLTGFRKKKTVIENLEEIDKQIKDYEKYKQKNELRERKFIAWLILYSFILYITAAVVYFIYLMPTNLTDRVKTLIPFFISPVVIYSVRKFLKWFFIKRSVYFEKRLNDLKDEKKSILEDVKEKETYKKAKEILERFSSGVDISITPPATPAQPANRTQAAIMTSNGNTNLIHRNVNKNNLNASMRADTSILNKTVASNGSITHNNNNTSMNSSVVKSESTTASGQFVQPTGPPPSGLAMMNASANARTLLPRPIINPNRTFFDKVLDFIIGEGPSNRYALICRNCHFHNGMALKEEFEYIAFRCAYCLFYNEARRTKITIPKQTSPHLIDQNVLLNTTNAPQGLNKSVKQSLNESVGSQFDTTSSPSTSFDELSEPLSTSTAKLSVGNKLNSSSLSNMNGSKYLIQLNGNRVRRNSDDSTASSKPAATAKNKLLKSALAHDGSSRSVENLQSYESNKKPAKTSRNDESNMMMDISPQSN